MKHNFNKKHTGLAIVGIIMAIVLCFGIANSVAEDNIIAEVFPSGVTDVLGERVEDCTHENTSEVILNEGPCGERKESKIVCDDCGAHISTYLGVVTQHNWETISSTPETCVSTGETVDKCTLCGEERTLVPIKSVKADNSLHNVEAMVTEATCLKPSMEVEYCSECNTVFSSREAAPALGHKAGSYVVTSEATCSKDGRSVSYCTRCDFVMDTKITKATGHDYKEAGVIASNCTYEGYELYKCNNCGNEKKDSIEINPNAHVSVFIERTEATCDMDGSVTSVCGHCGKVLSEEVIPALNHIEGEWVTEVEGDCTHGIEKTHYCGRCGEAFEFMMSTPLGHSWKTLEVVSSTCAAQGHVRQECTVCGEEQRIPLPPSHGHVEGREEHIDDPNSEFYNCTVTYCEVCGDIIKVMCIADAIARPDDDEIVELAPPIQITDEAINGEPIIDVGNEDEIISNDPCTTSPEQGDVVVDAD